MRVNAKVKGKVVITQKMTRSQWNGKIPPKVGIPKFPWVPTQFLENRSRRNLSLTSSETPTWLLLTTMNSWTHASMAPVVALLTRSSARAVALTCVRHASATLLMEHLFPVATVLTAANATRHMVIK